MSQPSSPESMTEDMTEDKTAEPETVQAPETQEPPPSYVKLAMRNMVRKSGISWKHFTLTTIGLLGFLIGLSYLTR